MRLTDGHRCRVAAVVLITWTLLVLVAAAADASCATGSPARSPAAFVGTVIATNEGGRVAEVVTDEGLAVTVKGTDSTSWFSDSYSYSSVDRQYAVGGRYEFHPVDTDSPYSDNACTATRQLSGPTVVPLSGTPGDRGRLPGWLPVDEQAGPPGYELFFGPLVVVALGLFALIRRLVRRRRAEGTVG